jgi:hypothetical protein
MLSCCFFKVALPLFALLLVPQVCFFSRFQIGADFGFRQARQAAASRIALEEMIMDAIANCNLKNVSVT